MSLTVFCTVLFAAALHAGWNIIVKGAPDKLFTTILVAASASAFGAAAIPFVPLPSPRDAALIAASTAVHVAYYVLVANAYRLADISQSYPLMRGAAPLLVAMVGAAVFGEALPFAAWIGVCLISFGIISMVRAGSRKGDGKGIAVAILNAGVIATYTLLDAIGVRGATSPLSYMMWLSFATGLPLVGWVLLTRRVAFVAYASRHFALGAAGGVVSVVAYGLSLWAMTVAPVAMVAALRETSILFATAIAAVLLREPVDRYRAAAVGVIAAGAVALRLA